MLIVWWLVPIIGLFLVFVTSYQAVTSRRFDNTNGITGELLAGSSVGQSFVARYDNLSGVEVHLGTYVTGSGPARSSLVLHLREGPNSQGVPGRDIATATLPEGSLLAENPWYLFSFPPISDSQDRSFYVEVTSPDGAPGHALTLFWWQPDSASPKSDPYASGNAYLNGRPQSGDLAFGLQYAPSPISAATQVARAISANLPGPVMLLLFGGTLAALVGLYFLLARLREPERRRRWLRRWSLPFVLGVALLCGLLYLFLVPPWQGPDEHSHFAYAALLDHYNLDYTKVESIYLDGRTPDAPLADDINASMVRHDFTRLISGDPDPGAPPDAGATLFTSLGKPPAYYWLGAVALRAARALGVAADPFTNPDTSLLVLRALSLALGVVVVALAWLAARLVSSDDGNWLILLLPLTVALLPMHTFDIAIFNNDVLAEVAVSALFVALAALVRRPSGWRAVALAALSVLLALSSLFTKPTAEAAAPLLAGGLLIWIGQLVTMALERRAKMRANLSGLRPSPPFLRRKDEGRKRTNPQSAFVLPSQAQDHGNPQLLVPGVMVGLLALLGIGSLLLAYEPQDQTVGWVTSWVPLRPMTRTETPTAHNGRFVLDLGPKGHQAVTAVQMILPPIYHPVLTATVSGWVRTAPGAGKPLVKSPAAVMRIEAGGAPIGRSDVPLSPASVWQPISTTAHIAEGAQQLVLRITSTDQRAQFDDFTMKVDKGPVAWHDPVFQPTLLNPSAEAGIIGLRPELASRLPMGLVALADVLPNPQPFDKPALWAEYANGQYTSFWGNFGWLSIPLPDSLYIALTIITLLALVGLVVRLAMRGAELSRVSRGRKTKDGDAEPGTKDEGRRTETVGWTTVDWLGLVALFSLVATLGATYAWQTMQLATRSLTAGLSGRYLFVLIVPIIWLLVAGLEATRTLLVSFHPFSRLSRVEGTGVEAGLPWAVWLYVTGLMLFAAFCLLTLIIPYYYS